jgi:PAS domain S-box-containing protein
MRISTKLSLILVSAVVLVMAGYAAVTISRTRDLLSEEQYKMGDHVSMALGVGVLHHLRKGEREGVADVLATASRHQDIIGAAVFDREGELVAASDSVAAELGGDRQIHTEPEGAGGYARLRNGRRVYAYRTRIMDEDGQVVGSLRLILGEESLLPYVIEARNYILVTILVLSGVLVLLIVYFSRTQIASPLRTLAEGAQVLGRGALEHRIQIAAAGEIGALATAFNGMASSLQASTQAIVREREYIRSIVDSISDGVVVIDHAQRITHWNRTMEERYGLPRERVLHSSMADTLPGLWVGEFPQVLCQLLAGEVPNLSVEGVRLDVAPERIWRVTGAPLREAPGHPAGAVLVLVDTTEHLALEEQVQRSEKLAAVGQLAAGVAHEIGTPLNVISGSAEYLLMGGAGSGGSPAELRTIVSEVERISGLVKQLMAFARHETPREQVVDLGVLIEGIMVLLRRQLEKQGVQIHVDLDPALPAVAGDPHQLQQVLLNLVMNAWQAMSKGGELLLAGRHLAVDPTRGTGHAGDAGWVELAVQDTGCGIPVAHLARVFEPFFTTKEVGQGTGLGLAIAQRIVEDHGGRITAASRPGAGTVMTVRLPAYVGAATDG